MDLTRSVPAEAYSYPNTKHQIINKQTNKNTMNRKKDWNEMHQNGNILTSERKKYE